MLNPPQRRWDCKRVCSNTRGVNCTVCWSYWDIWTINMYIYIYIYIYPSIILLSVCAGRVQVCAGMMRTNIVWWYREGKLYGHMGTIMNDSPSIYWGDMHLEGKPFTLHHACRPRTILSDMGMCGCIWVVFEKTSVYFSWDADHFFSRKISIFGSTYNTYILLFYSEF